MITHPIHPDLKRSFKPEKIFSSEKDDIPPQSSKPETLLGKNALEVLPQIKMQRASNLGLNHSRVEQYSSEKQVSSHKKTEYCFFQNAMKMADLRHRTEHIN